MSRRGYVSVTTEVDVEVDPEDLADAGYHHQDDCNSGGGCVHPEKALLDRAIDDLHQQAGHGEFPVYVCTKEPCRSLYLAPATSGFIAAPRRSVAA